MNPIWIAFLAGAGAFAHCLGMCGGFALHLSRGRSRSEMLGRQLLWHGGKTFTYVFLGGLAGLFGVWLGAASQWPPNPSSPAVAAAPTFIPRVQHVLAYAAGGVMILMGASLLGLFPWRVWPSADAAEKAPDGLFATIFRQFLGQPTATGALALGMATGFLPCPVVLAALAWCVQSGSPATGMAVMAAFGVGTIWSLLLLGLFGHALNRWLRKWGSVVFGVVLVLLGLAMILRRAGVLPHLPGHPAVMARFTTDERPTSK